MMSIKDEALSIIKTKKSTAEKTATAVRIPSTIVNIFPYLSIQ